MRSILLLIVSIAAAPACPVTAASPVEALWARLDAVNQEEVNLAWSRWKALSRAEQIKAVQPLRPVPQVPQPGGEPLWTPEEAEKALAEYERQCAKGDTQALERAARQTLTAADEAAFRERRHAIIREASALGAQAVPELVEGALKEGPHREDARSALHGMGAVAVPGVLEAAAAQKDERARENLLGILAGNSDPRVVAAFQKALKSVNDSLRGMALSELGSRGLVSEETYLSFLQEHGPYLRRLAVYGLEKVGSAAAIGPLEEVARHDLTVFKEHPQLRGPARDAISAISKRTGAPVELQSEEPVELSQGWSFEEVAAAAECGNAGIRQSAAEELRFSVDRERAPMPREAALQLLEKMSREDPDAKVREAAKAAAEAIAKRK